MREDGGSLRIETPLQAPARKVATVPRDPSRVVSALADSFDRRLTAVHHYFGLRSLFSLPLPSCLPLLPPSGR